MKSLCDMTLDKCATTPVRLKNILKQQVAIAFSRKILWIGLAALYCNEAFASKEPEAVELSSAVASSICGVYEDYMETKKMPEEVSLASPPQGYPILTTSCNTWVRDCDAGECTTWSMARNSKCAPSAGSRVIGGEDASASDAPWDVNMKFIYDWGSSRGDSGKFTGKEKETNNVSSIKEQHRCTGFFYTRSWIVTTGWCGYRGIEFARTRNRYVAWLARKRFYLQEWCVYKSNQNSFQSCDVHLHPKFHAFVDPYNDTTNPGIQDREYDISIIYFYKPFSFEKYKYMKALPLAKKGQEFTGKAFFAGWGTTDERRAGAGVGPGNGGRQNSEAYVTVLQKIELTIMPFKPDCEQLVKKYIEKGGVFDPKKDYSEIFFCAKPDEGDKQALCGGDIGGALVCTEGDKRYVCGMRNSWGATQDCLKDKDGTEFFIKINHVVDWIEEVAGPQPKEDLEP